MQGVWFFMIVFSDITSVVDEYAYVFSDLQSIFDSAAVSMVSVLLSAFLVASLWIIFQRAGQHGWAALIPIYNVVVLFRITWGSGVFALLTLIPCAGSIIGIITTHKLSRSFGHGVPYTLGMLFFPYVFYPLIAFGSRGYRRV